MPAFEHAVDLGYRYLETDVHVTADGVVVAFHDDDLQRTCGRPGRDLRAAVARGRRRPASTGSEPIPRLDDLLERVARRPAQHRLQDRPAPSSRWPTSCARAGVARPGVRRPFSDRRAAPAAPAPRADAVHERRAASSSALLRVARRRRARPLRRAGARAQAAASRSSPSASCARAHRRGIEVHVWTIDDADEMDRLLDLGVDGIMTDRPAVLRDVLERRGQWIER